MNPMVKRYSRLSVQKDNALAAVIHLNGRSKLHKKAEQ